MALPLAHYMGLTSQCHTQTLYQLSHIHVNPKIPRVPKGSSHANPLPLGDQKPTNIRLVCFEEAVPLNKRQMSFGQTK